MGYLLLDFIKQELYILVPVLWVIGNFLKRTPYIKSWYIPWILLGISVSFTCALVGLSIEAIIQGILITGGAVLVHQLIKQTRERK